MPAQWTGDLVGKMHNNSVTGKMLAEEVGWNEKYLSQVLNSSDPPRKAEEKLNAAFDRILEKRSAESAPEA